MTRRIVLLIIVLIVLGTCGVGAYLFWARQTDSGRMLRQGELALKANQGPKALELAERYIQKNPTDWAGYYLRARAYLSVARYSEARDSLQKAAELNPSEVVIKLTLADTYSHPGARMLADVDVAKHAKSIEEAIDLFQKAIDVLSAVKTSDPAKQLDVKGMVGIDYAQIAVGRRLMNFRLTKDAAEAEAARLTELRDKNIKAAKQQALAGQEAEDHAMAVLCEVIRSDPSREAPARSLVTLCIDRQDKKNLEIARKAIMSLEDKRRPPVATMILVMYDLRMASGTVSPTVMNQKVTAAAKMLDGLLQEHGNELEVKLSRIRLAMLQDDLDLAEKLCNEITKKDPRQGQARLYHAQILMRRANLSEAQRELLKLKTEFPEWQDAYLNYAQAALAAGNSQLAGEAMRELARLNPHAGAAYKFMAELELQGGYYEQAFTDAKAYYESQPDEPEAIRLFVEAAKHTGQSNLAASTLESALRQHPDKADVLLAVVEGYSLLDLKDEAMRVAKVAAQVEPKTEDGQIAVAQAMALTGRSSDAENLLTTAAAQHPDSARVHFELARLFSSTGRTMQALEHYQAASRFSQRNAIYRMALARALFDVGMVEASQAQCQEVLAVEPANSAAILLEGQIRIVRGESIDVDQLLVKAGKDQRMGLPLALAYLGRDPNKCITICLEELKKKPADIDILSLLGQAYFMTGQEDKCLQQWKAIVKASPKQMAAYISIANVLRNRLASLEDVRKELLSIPRADQSSVGLAMGTVYRQTGDLDRAAEEFGRIAAMGSLPEDIRNQATLMRVDALARLRKADLAIQALAPLLANKLWSQEAMFEKALLLIQGRNLEQAQAVLKEVQKMYLDAGNIPRTMAVAELYTRMKRDDLALDLCEQLRQAFPRDPRPYLFRAALELRGNKYAQAVASYETAIRQYPANMTGYLSLAKAMDGEHDLMGALDVLKRMEAIGQSAQMVSLFEQASLYLKAGLNAQAAQCLEKLASMGLANNPKVKFALGKAFADLGMTDQARACFKEIPIYTPYYVLAQQVLAHLADGVDAKMQILNELAKLHRGEGAIALQELSILTDQKRWDQAIEAFHSFADKIPPGKDLPPSVAFLAVQAMVEKDQYMQAAELCARLAKQGSQGQWNSLAALLAIDANPGWAKGRIASRDKADVVEAQVGLLLSAGDARETDAWCQRIIQIDRDLASGKPPKSLPRMLVLLVELSAGQTAQVQRETPSFKGMGLITGGIVSQLVDSCARDPQGPARARKLLHAQLLSDMSVPSLSRKLAMEVLKADPRCQWAAAIVIGAGPDQAVLKELQQTLEPKDCTLARIIDASLLFNQRQYDKAAEIYGQINAQEKDNLEYVYRQAVILESAGRLAEALKLYERVLSNAPNPVIGNNAAYLVTQTAATDKPKLGQALAWTEAALKFNPDNAAYRDTNGWIYLLLGRQDQALRQLRRAIVGLSDSPEAHYHLAMAESAAGDKELARWHFQAAVNLGNRPSTSSQPVAPSAAKAIRAAAEELAKLQPNP